MEKFNVLWMLISVICLLLIQRVLSLHNGYSGCYERKKGLFDDNEKTTSTTFKSDANGSECKSYCRTKGYRYAGIKQMKNDVLCFCGEEIKQTVCEEKCRGNEEEDCRKEGKVVLYDTWLCATFPCKNKADCENIDADDYICNCNDEWKRKNCDEDSESVKDESTAAYILIPITVGTIVIIVAMLVYKRRRRTKQILNVADHKPSSQVRSLNNTLGVVNYAYSEDQTYAMPSDVTGDISVVRTREPYAEISPDELPMPTDKGLTNQSTSAKNKNIAKGQYSYAEFSSKDLQTNGSASANHQQANRHHYNHLNVKGLSNIDRGFGYSWLTVNEPDKKPKLANDPYSHLVLGKEETTSSNDIEDKNYSRLQTPLHSKKTNQEKTKHFEMKKEKNTDYDHASAGGKNPNMDARDEYSHLHQKTTQSATTERNSYPTVTRNKENKTDALLDGNKVNSYEQTNKQDHTYFILEPMTED